MKVLSINDLYFLLPAGFDGGLADALRALADYHESVTGSAKQKITYARSEEPIPEHREASWTFFWRIIHGDSGHRVVGKTGVLELDAADNAMKVLDVNTGLPRQENS